VSTYFKEHNKVFVAPNGAKEVFDHLPPGQYILRYNPLTGYYLENNGSFTVPEKIFGDVEQRVKRVLKTYFHRNCNTGVLLSGDKGAGKTMFARLLSIRALEQGIPTVIVNDNFGNDIGLNKFISDIEDRCIIMFDEFEKVFDKDEDQNKVLSLFDGTYQSNKLFVLTANDTFKVSNFILNRPGRVYYHFRYTGIEEDFIREFCDYHLDDKSHTESFISLAKVVGKFNFDMLQALVQECNIHQESPQQVYQMMNIDLDGVRDKFSYSLIKISTGKKRVGEETCSIYDRHYMYWDGDKEDDNDNDETSITFEYSDIQRYDREAGVFVFEKDDFRLEMKRERKHFFSLAF
jgi:hypothetical protein